jgi:hypothetical protein
MHCQRGDTPPDSPEPLGRGQLLQSRLTEFNPQIGHQHVSLDGDGPRTACRAVVLRGLLGSTPRRRTN